MAIRGPGRWSRLVIGAVVAAAGGPAAPAARAQSDDPPRAFVRAWQATVGGVGQSGQEGAAALAATPAWEPYVRAAYHATADQTVRDRLRPALIQCQAPLHAWNLERAKTWAKDLRFDYLTDLAAATDDPKVAAELAAHLIVMQKAVFDRYRALPLAWPGRQPPPPTWMFLAYKGRDYAALSGQDGFQRYSGDYVRVPKEHRNRPAFIHARAGTVAAPFSEVWISLSSTQLAIPHDARQSFSWYRSVVCINASATFATGSMTLFVCDGDINLDNPASISAGFSQSVIVANGDVIATEEEINSNCFVYAAGDFSGKDRGYQGYASIAAGGKIVPMPPADHGARKYYKEGVKENPLGIKFVSPADAGVGLDVGDKVVRLGQLTDASPLAKAGLNRGDRVLALNGVPMETAAGFRRQLRESLLWGTGLFEVKRGDQTFLRLVKFAEPPKK